MKPATRTPIPRRINSGLISFRPVRLLDTALPKNNANRKFHTVNLLLLTS